ncbi:MAG: peptidylprolyl isomerase [Polyangiaceae bacterium]
MQRWTAVVFGVLLVVATVVIVRGVGMPPRTPKAAGSGASSGRPVVVALNTSSPKLPTDLSMPAPAVPMLDLDGGVPSLPTGEPIDAGGTTLPSGSSAPQLDDGAPKNVRFGAVLVEYRGAETASRTTRTRDEALEIAKKLAADAHEDFAAAVKAGDKGSGEDFGSVPRGVFEPAPEYVLFNLKPGEVSEPVDSPRGFYVFKRID